MVLILVFLSTFILTELFRYLSIKNEVMANAQKEAKIIQSILMATRRVYHHQFIDSEIPLTDKTLGFLPAHSLSLISKDFSNWIDSGLYFNNVSERPRNQRNIADSIEKEAISYFQENRTEKERFISFKSAEGKLFFHYSTPIRVEKYCLKCHGKKADAPFTIRNKYDTAYNYQIGELRGIMSIKLPGNQLKVLALASFLRDLWIHLAGFLFMFCTISWFLRRYVTTPISKLVSGLNAVSEENYNQPVEGLPREMAIVGKTLDRMSKRIKLRESELRGFAHVLEESLNEIYIFDAKTFRFVHVNKGARLNLGYSIEELINRTPLDIKPEFTAELFEKKVKPLRVGESETVQFTTVHQRKDDSLYDVEVYLQLSTFQLVPVFVAIIIDITERKNMEQQLVQAQKLESMGQLAAGVAHEINTPAQFISDNTFFIQDAFSKLSPLLKKYSHVLEMNKAGSVTPEMIREMDGAAKGVKLDYLTEEIPLAISEAQDGIKRVTEIVKSMKTFSHPDVNEKVYVDINMMIKSTITVSRHEWKYVADLETNLASDLPPAPCYPGEFNQVILNLIVNAAHAIGEVSGKGSEDKGKITISTHTNEGSVEVRISDTGTGIPENKRSRIFEPFFTTKDVGKGTGQGLAIAHAVVVKKHKGTIRFDSEIGKGTTFIICLPLSDQTLSFRSDTN